MPCLTKGNQNHETNFLCSGLFGHAANFLRRKGGGLPVANDNQPEDSTSRAGNSASRSLSEKYSLGSFMQLME